MAMSVAIKSGNSFVDITNKIALGGVKWQRNDIDGVNAGRNILGSMERDRVATKMRLDITCTLLNETEVASLLQLIAPEYVQVKYDDPQLGNRTVWMYSNNNPAVFSHFDSQSKAWWKEVTFPLIEV